MIRVVDISHHYGVKPVLSHVNFDVPTGELVAVMGPNGVGKSTLLSIIAGLMAPAKGHVEINGLHRRANEETELQIRRQMVFLPDQPWLPEFKTGRECLMAIGQLYDVDDERLMTALARSIQPSREPRRTRWMLFRLSSKGA